MSKLDGHFKVCGQVILNLLMTKLVVDMKHGLVVLNLVIINLNIICHMFSNGPTFRKSQVVESSYLSHDQPLFQNLRHPNYET